jgi:hypothetical protein
MLAALLPRPTLRLGLIDVLAVRAARALTSGRGPDGGMGRTPTLSESEIAQMVATNEFAATDADGLQTLERYLRPR